MSRPREKVFAGKRPGRNPVQMLKMVPKQKALKERAKKLEKSKTTAPRRRRGAKMTGR